MERRTAPELWREAVRNAPNAPAYLEEGPEGWSPVSWDEATERIEAFAQGLLAHGVRHGDAVAVLARTSVDWILLDWAIMSIGAVVVGLDVTLMHGAPALLLDRRAALPMQGAERHVLPLGRQSKADGDVDQAEADGSVPDRAHGKGEF